MFRRYAGDTARIFRLKLQSVCARNEGIMRGLLGINLDISWHILYNISNDGGLDMVYLL